MKTHSQTLEAQMANGHIFICCWWFWSLIYRKTTFISSHSIHQKILPRRCWLDHWPVLWNKNRLELWSAKKCWHRHVKVCNQLPSMNPNTHIPKYPNMYHTNGNTQTTEQKKRSKEESSLDILTEQRRKLIQKVVGKCLYYGRTVNTKLLVVLGSIIVEKSKGTTQTEAAIHQF